MGSQVSSGENTNIGEQINTPMSKYSRHCQALECKMVYFVKVNADAEALVDIHLSSKQALRRGLGSCSAYKADKSM